MNKNMSQVQIMSKADPTLGWVVKKNGRIGLGTQPAVFSIVDQQIRHGNRCVDTWSRPTKGSADLTLYGCNKNVNQRFRIEGGEGAKRIIPLSNDQLVVHMDMTDQSSPELGFSDHVPRANTQLWLLRPTAAVRTLSWNLDSFANMAYHDRFRAVFGAGYAHQFDLIATMETGSRNYENMHQHLKAFESFHVNRQAPNPYMQGQAIFWRSDKFALLDTDTIMLAAKGVVPVVRLLCRHSGRHLVVLAVHLKSWPAANPCHDVRKRQCAQIKQYLADQIQPSDDVLITGDWNEPKDTQAYNMRGIMDTFHLRDVYASPSNHPDGTTMNDQQWLVDYALLSQNLPISNVVPTGRAHYEFTTTVTDHYPLAFTFQLKPSPLSDKFEIYGSLFERVQIQVTTPHNWHGPLYVVVGGSFMREHVSSDMCGPLPREVPIAFVVTKGPDSDFLLRDPGTTHNAAFGSDMFDVPTPIVRKYFPPDLHHQSWVIVWKWPHDMFGAHTGIPHSVVDNIPLPVGTYGLHPDGWDNAIVPTHEVATKWRVRTTSGRTVHYLSMYDDKRRIAMVSSISLYKTFGNDVGTALQFHVQTLLRQLLDQFGIIGFSCHGQHHAVVFYQDSNGTVLHPVLLANMIRTRPDLRTVFKAYGLGVWARDYEQYFLNS